jgi:hypothetical protein
VGGFGFGVLLECMEVLTQSYTYGLSLLMVGNASPDETFTKLGGMFGFQGAVWKELDNVDWWTSAHQAFRYTKPGVSKIAQAWREIVDKVVTFGGHYGRHNLTHWCPFRRRRWRHHRLFRRNDGGLRRGGTAGPEALPRANHFFITDFRSREAPA